MEKTDYIPKLVQWPWQPGLTPGVTLALSSRSRVMPFIRRARMQPRNPLCPPAAPEGARKEGREGWWYQHGEIGTRTNTKKAKWKSGSWKSFSTTDSLTFRSAITRCHWSSLRGAAECTVNSTGPFPTSKEKKDAVGRAGLEVEGDVGAGLTLEGGEVQGLEANEMIHLSMPDQMGYVSVPAEGAGTAFPEGNKDRRTTAGRLRKAINGEAEPLRSAPAVQHKDSVPYGPLQEHTYHDGLTRLHRFKEPPIWGTTASWLQQLHHLLLWDWWRPGTIKGDGESVLLFVGTLTKRASCRCQSCELALESVSKEQNAQRSQKSLASEHFKSSSVPLLRIVASEEETA
ncbi:hypothetical protein EYF80_025957 [Liparis tanakae]|uniref:Uncharacterized protein n=1 Tax=Liparis tanakae TaxID=230148 RepID=A0A4Z2HDC1_9TELE|nr:hypothetical protein EYF80_025957 [Liparis tanakae]